MGFSLNPVEILKTEVLKYKDKAGHPEVEDALAGVEKAVLIIDNFVSKLTPADVEEVLALLPAPVASKFAPGELTVLAAAIANLPAELKKIEAAITKLETELAG
jgi:hypothetical protein